MELSFKRIIDFVIGLGGTSSIVLLQLGLLVLDFDKYIWIGLIIAAYFAGRGISYFNNEQKSE